MAFHQQNVIYCSSAKYAAVTAWAATTAKTVGQLVRQTAPTLGNERIWMCYVAGTTGGAEPTWTTSRGDKIATDGTVSWIEVTGLPAVNGDSVNTPNWTNGAKSTNISQGHMIQDVAGTHYFVCTVSGNAGTGAEPTWNVGTLGATTTDASATWVYAGTVSSFHSSPWAAPHKTLVRAMNTNWMDSVTPISPQRIYVGSDHAETQASAMSFPVHGTNNLNNGNTLDVVCVNVAGSMPPVSADLATTGTVTVTSSNSIQVGAGCYRWVYGLTFTAGNSANISVQFTGDAADRFYENCTFVIPSGAGSGANMDFNGAGRQVFKNCTFTFSNAGHSFNGTRCNCEFDGCTFNGTAPTTNGLFLNATNGRAVFRDCDFSAWTNAIFHSGNGTFNSTFIFRDCVMPTGWTPGDVLANGETSSSEVLVFSRCNISGSVNPYQFWQNDQAANTTADILTARASGAQDGGTPISWKIVTKANTVMNSSDTKPPVIAEWNGTTGANVTATIFGVMNAAALPTNDYCFVDVDYLGTAPTLGVRKTSRIADYLATPSAVTADTSDWTAGTVAARANTHAYSVGDEIKLASNTGRIFFCTTAGTSASSEPGGYATAVDGGSVTDGTAIFRAGVRFKIAITLTSPQPQSAGNVYAQIHFGLPSATIFFDPLLTLT